jgi:ribosomal protein S18 acetylase RimI-like enzyme
MVREATPDDAEAIARLAARTFPLACPPTTPPEAIEAHIRDELNAQRFAEHMQTSDFFVVDADDGEVCGYVMVAHDPPTIEQDWRDPVELRRIYVDADRHTTGVAADLMQTALEFAARKGHDWIWLGTNEANTRALRFYEKFGFRVVGKRTFCVADSIECDHVLARPVR